MKVINSDIKYSFLYIFFEGLAKGGNQVLLLCVAALIGSDLYMKMILLISLQVIIMLLYIPNYTDVLYAIDINKERRNYKSSLLIFSLMQYCIYLLLYFVFRARFYDFYGYTNDLLIFIILGIGILSCMIRFDSVDYQLRGKHSEAILYRSMPFGISFIASLVFFLLGEDKILSFFTGQFTGLLAFYCYSLLKNREIRINSFKLDLILNYGKRAKYSFLVAILGWSGGLGFLNFAKLFSESANDLIQIGYAVNVFTIFLLLGYGIDQVFVPKLKLIYKESLIRARALSKKVHVLYIVICFLGFLAYIGMKYLVIENDYFENVAVIKQVADVFGATPIALFVFLLSSFHWVSTPFYQIADIYQEYFKLNLIAYMIPWLIILFAVYLGYHDLIVLYLFLWIIKVFVPYFYVRNFLNRVQTESFVVS
jgi:hypothetical protein